jgi:serine/threonine protein kinase
LSIHHGDIKPENILLTSWEPVRIKLCDMGCGGFMDQKTENSEVRGTVPFMAPEMLERMKMDDQTQKANSTLN